MNERGQSLSVHSGWREREMGDREIRKSLSQYFSTGNLLRSSSPQLWVILCPSGVIWRSLDIFGKERGGARQVPSGGQCACSVAKSYPTLCDPMDCSPARSSVHGISQASILEWVAISSSSGSSQPRDRTCVSCISRQIL